MMNIDFNTGTPKRKRDEVRYQMRNEIENIIKEKHIDRNLFHEVSKFRYAQILRKFYYTFCTHDESTVNPEQPELMFSYLWLKFRKNLTTAEVFRCTGWETDIHHLYAMIPEYDNSTFCYLVTDGG